MDAGRFAQAIPRGVPSARPRIHALELQRDRCLLVGAGCSAVVGKLEWLCATNHGACESGEHGRSNARRIDSGNDQQRFSVVRGGAIIARCLSCVVVTAQYMETKLARPGGDGCIRLRDVGRDGDLESALHH
jgi:hypothetical protein